MGHPGQLTGAISPGVIGLVVWFMLAPRLPALAVLRMPTVMALFGFAVYVLLGSLASGRLVSIAYALQYAFYILVGGVLIAGYIEHRTRQGRQAEVWRILAWVGAIYVAGIIISVWTGPIYAYRLSQGGKHYGSLLIPRYVGFSESVNVAGGIAAVVAAFFLLLYPSSRLHSAALALLSMLGMVLTLSRSAIGALISAVALLGMLLAVRAIFVRGKVRLRIRLLPVGLVVLVIVAGIASYQQPIVADTWQKLALDQSYRDQDIDARLEHWNDGLKRWIDLPLTEKIIGAGSHSGGLVRRRLCHLP
jgi:hypothetical protein